MITKVVTGGQSGADLAGWKAAKDAGIACSGWMPFNFRTEDGPRPEYAELYGATQHAMTEYQPRTRDNLRMSNAALIFDTSRTPLTWKSLSPGTKLVTGLCMRYEIPNAVIRVELDQPIDPVRPVACAKWLVEKNVQTLFVGGNRASKAPSIEQWVYSYLSDVFRTLKGE